LQSKGASKLVLACANLFAINGFVDMSRARFDGSLLFARLGLMFMLCDIHLMSVGPANSNDNNVVAIILELNIHYHALRAQMMIMAAT